jgi:transmembrane sensor
VNVADGSVRDIGTAFDVEKLDDGARTLVTQGIVELNANDGQLRLKAGEAGQWHGGRAPTYLAQQRVVQSTGWRAGRLSFTDQPLAEVIATLDRYSTKRLILLDRKAGALHVSGVVRAEQADSGIAALARSQGLTSTDLGFFILLH